MKLLLTSAAIAAMTFAPVAAHAQFGGLFGGSSGNTLLGAGTGAGLGALIAGQGNNVEGALLGAALGGVASNAFAPQGQSFGGGFGNGGFGNNGTFNTLAGAGAGAGIGALIAGQGNNVEGALLGAALGGVAGNAFLPRSQGQSVPSHGGFPAQGGFPVQQGHVFTGAPTGFVNSGQFISGPVVPVTRYVQPQVQPVYINRTVYVQRPAPAPVVHRVVVPAPQPVVIRAPQAAPCPSNTTPQADGSCLDRNVTKYSNPVQGRTSYSRSEPCPSGSTKQGDGTCLSPMVTHIDRTAEYIAPAPVQQQVWVQQPVQAVAPVQQEVFCYAGSTTQYDSCGNVLTQGAKPKKKGWLSNPFK